MAKRIVLFQKPGCRDCNRTRDWLWAQPDVEVYERDLLLMPPDRAFLEREVQGESGALRSFLNPRSRTYRSQGFSARLPGREQLLDLLQADPSLIRRPIVVRGKRAVFGPDFPALEALLR